MLSDGTNTFTWNARDQVATLNGAGLQYDAFGRRTQNLLGTSFLYDGANAAQELSGTTATANMLTGGIDEFFNRTDSSGSFTPLKDALGSTIALVDGSGNITTSYSYDPFGNTTVSGAVSSNPSQYTGRENEGNGLYFYRARYYEPVLGRFISEDSLGFDGGSLNLFSYGSNNPINFKDPSGHCQFPPVLIQDPVIPIPPELVEQATDLAKPKQSLPMPDGGRLDISGKSHFVKGQGEIPTPHVHDPLPPFEEPYSQIPRGLNPNPRPATPEDFIDAIDHNRPLLPLIPPLPGLAGRKPHGISPEVGPCEVNPPPPVQIETDPFWAKCYQTGRCA